MTAKRETGRPRKVAELRQDLRRALDQVERGQHLDLDERGVKSLARQVKARGRRTLRSDSCGPRPAAAR